MKKSTSVTQRDGQKVTYKNYINPKKATRLARKKGLQGRLEIKHILQHNNDTLTHSMYIINTEDKIICGVHPFLHSALHPTLD